MNILKISKPRHTVAYSYTIEYIANIVQYLSTRPGTVIGSAGTGVGRTSYPQQKLVGRTILNIIYKHGLCHGACKLKHVDPSTSTRSVNITDRIRFYSTGIIRFDYLYMMCGVV